MSLKKLTQKIIDFRDERNWKQFHTPKDLGLSLLCEAAELVEHFKWAKDSEILANCNKEEIADELADVLACILLISHEFQIDLESHFDTKIKKNEAKYPAPEFKGKFKN
ncbi:MAG: nucleotide pyrophosphohydrolase [Bdellovibrionales bacterium]|nr:nucleotide pyrophosphohydrolase [Bdellovibrionales bacterium]